MRRLSLDGALVSYHAYEYWMMNKPSGVSRRQWTKSEDRAADLLGRREERTSSPWEGSTGIRQGSASLTNDRMLAHRLLAGQRASWTRSTGSWLRGILLRKRTRGPFPPGIRIGEGPCMPPCSAYSHKIGCFGKYLGGAGHHPGGEVSSDQKDDGSLRKRGADTKAHSPWAPLALDPCPAGGGRRRPLTEEETAALLEVSQSTRVAEGTKLS